MVEYIICILFVSCAVLLNFFDGSKKVFVKNNLYKYRFSKLSIYVPLYEIIRQLRRNQNPEIIKKLRKYFIIRIITAIQIWLIFLLFFLHHYKLYVNR